MNLYIAPNHYDIGISMSHKIRFLEVEHEVIVEKDPPYFLGDELRAKVKVRNLKAEPVKGWFCYVLNFPGGTARRMMEFDLGPNEEQVHPLYDDQPPYYLEFMGNFQIALIVGDPGRRFNVGGRLQIPSPHPREALFAGNVRDRDSYKLQSRMLHLTIAVVVLAAVEIICEVLRLVVG